MHRKFKNIPQNADTTVLRTLQTTFNGINCVYQFWQNNTMQGTSIIFYCDDVSEFTDKEIEHWIREFPLLLEKNTTVIVSRNKDSDYVIVSFNFLEI